MSTQVISLLGLPRTGKSTYIGALWLVVQDPTVGDIREHDVRGDRSYIESLAHQVAKCEEIQRTEVDSDQAFAMQLDLAGLGVADVEIPDLAGEATRVLVEDRTWRRVFADALSRSNALLLFVHPDHVETPIPANWGTGEGAEAHSSQNLPEFSPEKACTSAKLIELLENVLMARADAWPLRVGVVISAWDRVDNMTPRDWLAERLPGVHGLLESNPDLVRFSVFGVSAQGGRLPEQHDELIRQDVSKRVFAARDDGTICPIFEPLVWVVSQ